MFIPSSRTVRVALPALAASIGSPAAAFGQITINSGAVNVFANGTVGCQGSSSGNNVDDPAEVTGTSSQLTSGASTGGGPVAPGDLPTLPGCPASFTAASAAAELIEGTGSYRRIQQDLSMATQIINMGGNLCSHGANAPSTSSRGARLCKRHDEIRGAGAASGEHIGGPLPLVVGRSGVEPQVV